MIILSLHTFDDMYFLLPWELDDDMVPPVVLIPVLGEQDRLFTLSSSGHSQLFIEYEETEDVGEEVS